MDHLLSGEDVREWMVYIVVFKCGLNISNCWPLRRCFCFSSLVLAYRPGVGTKGILYHGVRISGGRT